MVNLTAKDQLRQRVAWALSEVLVISTHLVSETSFHEILFPISPSQLKNEIIDR